MSTLNKLPNIIACDFEAASRWTDVEKVEMKEYLEKHTEISREEKRQIRQYIESDGLFV